MKIGVVFGNPETTTGGNALKFYSSVRLDVRRIGAIKSGDEILGNRTAVKVVKNKMAPPFAKVEFDIMYGKGISAEGDILDLGVKFNVVEKSGAWFSYKGERLGQGRDNSKNFLHENPKLVEEIRQKVCEAKGINFSNTPKEASSKNEKQPAGGKEKVSKNKKEAIPRAH